MRTRMIVGVAMWLVFVLTSMGQSAEIVLLTGYQENNPSRYFKQHDQERGICIYTQCPQSETPGQGNSN